ncbi:hypothetical protein KM92DES2_12736 [uncultured Desulfovibrio sp.]|uniref:Uncharacterized protein n=1 Tax=uncultured Desulfovibrio sp. TaxID=167968 RepID=A0A212KD59_9BACT|nr:hypothetical protein KM92DES2_12736 [uncultured Desulfovibrio sp.]
MFYMARRLHGNSSPAHYDKTARHFLHSKADIAAAELPQMNRKPAPIKKNHKYVTI